MTNNSVKVVIDRDWDHPVAATETTKPSSKRFSRSKVPTNFVVDYKGRHRRIYSTNYGFNSEKLYILVKGRELTVESFNN